MGKISVATAELVGTILEALGYGVYLVISPQCLRIMLRRNLGSKLTKYFMMCIAANFVLITLHFVVDLTRLFEAYTANTAKPNAAEKFYTVVNTGLNVTKNTAYCAATLVADALLVYRTFVVWGRNYWIVLLPFLIFILDIAMSVWFTWSVTEAKAGNSVLVSSALVRSKYFFGATLALNFLCTALISYKIWKVQRQITSNTYVTSPSRGALSIILESAAIYSAALICLIGTAISGSASFFFFLNSMPPLIGSVFSYIILRSASEAKKLSIASLSTGENELENAYGARMYKHQGRINRSTHSEAEGVHVTLQHTIHHDGSYENDVEHEMNVLGTKSKLPKTDLE